jgi:hypothetical protein
MILKQLHSDSARSREMKRGAPQEKRLRYRRQLALSENSPPTGMLSHRSARAAQLTTFSQEKMRKSPKRISAKTNFWARSQGCYS